ncbi:MAG TPA: S9 family peptidase [Acidobacteriota bacterium]|jgi:dipeptidyl aminopeptidase/acylaminoacyl peptidase
MNISWRFVLSISLACGCICDFFPSALAQGKRFSVDDLIRVRRVSDPEVSPDGRWVVFTISEVAWEKNGRNTDLWVVSTEGGQPRRLTQEPGRDDSPRWSPDGKRIAFISTRDGKPQVWLAGIDGSAPSKVTQVSTGADGVVWSRDGKFLAFSSDVYPECADDDCNRRRDEQADKSMVTAKILDRLLFRHWNAWKDGKRTHILVTSIRGGAAKDVTPGDFDSPPFSLGEAPAYDFSPDAKELVFTRGPEKDEAVSTNSDVYVVSLTGPAGPRKISTSAGADTGAVYSPDGRYIAFKSQRTPGFESERWELVIYDRGTGQGASVTPDLDLSVDHLVWSPDSRMIYFQTAEKGHNPIYRYDLGTRKAEKVLSGNFSYGDASIDSSSRILTFSRQTFNAPLEVYRAAADGSQVQQLTSINQEFMRQFSLSEPESVTWKSKDGSTIQGFLIKPPFFNPAKKYPFLLLVHGGPQGAWSSSFSYRWNPQAMVSHDYVALMPNPRGSFGFGQKFTNEISGDWGGKVYEDLMAGVDYASRLAYVDSARMGAAGGSYGGYMVNWIEGHTDRFKALVSHAGVFNLTSMYGVTEELWFPEWEFKGTPWSNPKMYERWSPHNYVKNFKTPLLVVHGELDYRVPIGEGFQLFTSLQKMKVPSKMLYFPDEGHWIQKPQNSKLWYDTVLAWLDKWLRPNGE